MTDWLMVIITFVYVIATIFICVFNYRSAQAAKEQIELSKVQYEDDVRLKLMPCLCIEKVALLILSMVQLNIILGQITAIRARMFVVNCTLKYIMSAVVLQKK